MDRQKIRRELIARNALRAHGQDILMQVFTYYVENTEPVDLLDSIDRIYTKAEGELGVRDEQWVEEEFSWRTAKETQFLKVLGEKVAATPASGDIG